MSAEDLIIRQPTELLIPPQTQVVFDFRIRNRKNNIGIYDENGEHRHQIGIVHTLRLERTLQVARALTMVTLRPEDINDGWIQMTDISGGYDIRSRDTRRDVLHHVRTISDKFDGLVEFSRKHTFTFVRVAKPYSVSFTRQSRDALRNRAKYF